jgi:Na+-transporting NADH:ubiquinone oxidoreductase subunit NqrC
LRFTVLAATATAIAAAPTGAFAIDYLTVEQAQALMFPQADAFLPRRVALDAAQLRSVAARAGVPARTVQWQVMAAQQADRLLGYLVVDQVIGKFELITYAIAIDADGTLRQLEVLSYRESHGGEIRLPAWRRQFVGKRVEGPLRVGEDIANISGATLSCTHVTDGVRRIMAVLAVARADGLLP